MYRRTCAAAALAAVVSLSTAAPAAEDTPAGRVTLDRIVARLAIEGEAFAEAKDDRPPAVSARVAALTYSVKTIGELGGALQRRHGKVLVDLYVAYQLLQPIRSAGPEQLRKLKHPLIQLLQRCQYKQMPKWPRNYIRSLQDPARPSDDTPERKQRLRELRQRKFAAERPVVKHNRTVHALEGLLKKLLILMDERAADEALIERLGQEERKRLDTYTATLEVIRAEIVYMKKKERAKVFYDGLKELAFKVRFRRTYLDPAKPVYNPTGNSSFAARDGYFAVSTLKVVNLLATAARQPAMKIPKVGGKKPRRPPQRRR